MQRQVRAGRQGEDDDGGAVELKIGFMFKSMFEFMFEFEFSLCF